MIKLNVQFNSPIVPFGSEAVQKVIAALDKRLKAADTIINVRVSSAAELHKLNKKYAGKDESTDVLSFNYQEGAKVSQERSGDVVVSFDHVQSQAQEAATDNATELALLIMHGTLHVLGHDHQSAAELTKMDQLQGDVMKASGLDYRNFGWSD